MKRKASATVLVLILVLLLSATLIACNGAVDITLSFIVDGEVYHTIDTKGDGLITLPTNPTKEDYVFDGWFWEDGRPFTVNSLKDTPISEDLSVYAKWHSVEDEENDITITFTVIGGGAVPSQTIGYDGLINRPENPVRAGHILVGWFTDADCTTRWDFANGKVRTDIILYAKWVIETDMNSVEIVKAEGITVGSDTLKTTVPAAQDKYKVFDNLEANPYATIKVYRDEQGSQEIKLGLIDLVAGDNINYIMITSGTGTVNKLYTLTIHRNYIFDVTFNYNNGNSADTTKVEEGKLVSSRSAGSKTGYTFDKWQYNGSAWAFDTAKVTGNMTLDAKWNANKYPVSFDTNGGNSLNNTTVTYGQDFELSVPVREHYTFLGWETADGTTLTDEQGNSISSWDIPNETNLKAKWELKTYTISYTDTYDAENTNPTSFTFETETITLNSLSGRNGYTFIEWQDIEGEKVTSIPKGSSGESTLKAVWEIIDYTITYNNTFDLDNTNASGYNVETSTITLSNLSGRTGYTFNGWYTAPADGTKKTDIEKGSYGNLQLYARWTLIEYDIEYIGIYDTTNSNQTKYTIEDEFSLVNPSERAGYSFVEWQDASENVITDILAGTTGKLEIRAVWELVTYDIAYNNTKSMPNTNPTTYTYISEDITLTYLDDCQGYEFIGWYTALTGGIKKTTIAIGSYGNLNLYARWEIISYSIDYSDVYGVNNPNPTFYTIETPTINLVDLTGRNGYNFVEWQNTEGEMVTSIPKGSSGEITLKAVWEIIDYTITYNNTFGIVHSNPSTYTIETETITLTDLTGRTGYTFNGWYTAPTDGTKKTNIEKGSYGNLQLYARWTTNTYTVSLDRESSVNSFTISFDGNGYDLNIPTQTLTDESSLYYPDVPTRSGYIFSGWYENSEGTGNSFDFTAEIKTDIVLYAKWVSSSWPIYVGESKSIYISGQTYNNYEFIPLVSGNITIYTTGSVDTYGYLLQGNNQLTYNDDGGSGYNFSITYNVTAGTKYTIKVRGYGSGSSGNSVLYLNGVSKPTADGTVTSGSNAVTVSYGTNYSLGVPESIKGYAFDGWYTEIDCGGTKLTDATGASLNIWSIDGDIVVYSGYQRLPYNVELDANGGSTVSATSLYYGDRLDLNEYTTTRSGYSFIGWYLDISDSEAYEATTMPDHNLSLTAKWIVYNLNDFKYNIEKLAISEFDTINAALFNAELFDSDGELVEIEATLNGTQEAGQTVSIRLLANGKYDKKKQVTINNIKVYGMPSISYDTEKDYFNLSDTLNSALFGLSGKDTYDVDTITAVSVQQESYAAGDLVTVVLTSTDPAGNVTTIEIANVKVYGEPDISYTETKTDIKASDTVGNELWNVSALDSFGETLSATTEIISGSQAAGNTITVRISSTDSKGNTRNITFDVRVYGTPTIGTATKTDFKVSDDITVESLGIGATDSYNGTVEDVSIIVKSGTQTSGTYMIYTVTAVDLVGNIATKDITVKIFDLPVFAPQTKTGIKTNDDLSLLSPFAVTAKDSFNAPLTVVHTLKSGSQTGGTVMVYTFTATDASDNITSVEYSYQVYAQSDITITYTAGASDLVKLTSQGEEFFVTATDSFGEPCTIKLLKADGTVATSGTTINIIFRATDAAGNYKDTPVISNIKIYGTPIAAYTYDYYCLKQGDNIDFMFTVRDSFNSELYADVTQISYESGIRTVSVTATDDAGNLFERTYELYQLAANQSYLALYSGTEFLGYHIVTQGEDYNLPVDFIGYNIIGYNIIGWQFDNQYITNSDGNSLSVWNKPSNGYRVQLISSLITYNISYILDGGVNNIDNPSTYTVVDLGGADGFITLQAPTKGTNITINSSVPIGDGRYENTVEITAYTFLGWHTDAAFSNEVSVITIALGSVTLYAKWTTTTTTTTTTTVSTYHRINASGVPTANGNYILFGEYPQTIKANEVTVGTSADTRGYYLSSDGYYYSKVTATPYSSGYTFSTSATVSSGTVYYFKVEPIKWRILEESGGTALILCESIIANKRYDDSSNNYMNSEIRAWLNGEFYNKAFTALQQELIQITNVDNSVYSTGYSSNSYACANTNDKIFLPSYREMVNTAYGFSSDYNAYDTARRRLTSDYSRATGASMSTYNTTYYGNGSWWLRSAKNSTSNDARNVYYLGFILSLGSGVDSGCGVVPALKIRLS